MVDSATAGNRSDHGTDLLHDNRRIPALLFHKVSPQPEFGITWITPNKFIRLITDLTECGWHTPRSGELSKDEKEQFLIVFDDGYECIYDFAFPALQQLNQVASLFVPTAYLGNWNNWDHQLFGSKFKHLRAGQLRILAGSGWLIGSHGVTHRAFTELSQPDLRNELVDSKAALEDMIGKAVTWLSCPFGRCNRRILQTAIDAGYTSVVSPAGILKPTGGIEVLEADQVYLWDAFSNLEGRLKREGVGYSVGRMFRRILNRASGGTIIWRRIFTAAPVELAE